MEITSQVVEKASQEGKELVICGDFNCDMLNPHSSCCRLTEVMSEFNLTQVVTSPTRVTQSTGTMIDLLFCSDPAQFLTVCCKNTGLSDHSLAYGVFKDPKHRHNQSLHHIRCYGKCDPEAFVSDLIAAPWQVMDTFDDVNDRWHYWKTLFLEVVNKHIPLRKVRNKATTLPWIDREIRLLMRTRNYFWNKAKSSRRNED